MSGAKSFFSKVVGISAKNSPLNAMKENKTRFTGGIGNTNLAGADMSSGGGGYMGTWGEDRMTNVAISIRVFQLVCAFCMLIVTITLATFQTKWIGKLSGLTALLLIVTVLTFILVAFLVVVSFLPHSFNITQDKIIRVLEQPRLGLSMNGAGVGIWLIVAMTQTISAYTSAGCKDPTKDPHVSSSKGLKDAFVAALPSFCTSKRAGAAFAWLITVSCIATLLLFLRMWKLSRRNGPRIPPFVQPGDDGAFEPIGEDLGYDEEDNLYARDQAAMPSSNRYGDGGDGQYGYSGYQDPRMPVNAYNGGPYDHGHSTYGQPSGGGGGDPFADQQAQYQQQAQPPRQSYDYGAYNASSTMIHDPYAAIQQQLRSERPPQLPPLYRG
jgi:hypothetical protein